MGSNTKVIDKSVILFDGVCNLCNASVDLVIKRDHKDYFKFASLQSDFAVELGNRLGFDAADLHSIILVENDDWYSESTAALRIARKLSGPWPFLYTFSIIPKSLRDRIYRWIARNRYRWFGKKNTCRVPLPREKTKFVVSSSLERA